MIEEFGAEKALCMALAYISGSTTKINKWSCITGEEGLETLEIKCDTEIKGPSFVLTLLNKIVSEAVTNKIQNIKILKTRLGAVFDVPEVQAKAI